MSNTSISASDVPVAVPAFGLPRPRRRRPGRSCSPLSVAVPRATCTQATRPGFERVAHALALLEQRGVEVDVAVDGHRAVAAVARADEAQPAALLGVGERLLLVARRRARLRSGMIQICRKCTGSVFEALNSLWRMPVPADMRCTSPGRITEPVPRLVLVLRARPPARRR